MASATGPSAPISFPLAHFVTCPSCRKSYELFSAAWCAHDSFIPSKLCPHCDRCLCGHPHYGDPSSWGEAPPAFRQHGLTMLFYLYL